MFLGPSKSSPVFCFLVLVITIQAGQQLQATAIYTPLSGPPHKPHPSTCRPCISGQHETGVASQWLFIQGSGLQHVAWPRQGHTPSNTSATGLPSSKPLFSRQVSAYCLQPSYCPVHSKQVLMLFLVSLGPGNGWARPTVVAC